MKLSAAILLSAVLGASAHPSGHDQFHARRSVEARDTFVVAKKPVPTPVPAPAPAAATPYAPASPSPSSSGGKKIPFCAGGNSKRATEAQILYQGNNGTPGHYGCNMMTVSDDIAPLYDYSVEFINQDAHDLIVHCWNKIGEDGKMDGFFNGNQALTFTLPANGHQFVVFDQNSQGGCSAGQGSVPLTSFGEYAGTWLEFDFCNESNGGWSGADASCLVPAKYGMAINYLNVCNADTCSTVNNGGTGNNAYLGGMEALDGVGLNISPGQAHLTCEVGGF